MNLSRFVQICGPSFFAVTAVLSIGLSVAVILLAVKAKRELLLSAFFPLCFLPLLIAVGVSLFRLLSSIDMQLDHEEASLRDPGLLLTMNLVPLFYGATASAVPAAFAMLGRWGLAWRASGIRLLPERKHEDSGSDQFDPAAWAKKDADDYIEQLVRPR
ncbi:hypothetical protein Mal15_49270 [Stieleria maiorica]|uniref:Uncharacterized protein n=1 Tax=Stieleria maiorica TaxID=2795974 RepID=A0A5B9MLI1_9BACT|nr:hypothetical protein [Stieleria maiorica]QEG00851.1 hypothetical protein Mal15_49270 [Stieleria maiorica]